MDSEKLRISEDQFWYRLIVSPKYKYLRHILLLSGFGFMIAQPSAEPEYIGNVGIYATAGFVVYFIGFLYLHAYYFVPKFLLRRRLYSYTFSMLAIGIVSFFLVCIMDVFLNAYRINPHRPGEKELMISMIEFLILYSIIVAASAAVKLFQHWLRNVDRFYRLQKASLQQELGILKNQINPHFLFNMLNNVRILISSDPERATNLLVSLSDLLRYQIYDCGEESVFLSADIQFLRDFLTLENSRRDDFSFSVIRNGDQRDVRLPAFLFIPFVENAVKHNHTTNVHAYVHVVVQLENNELNFQCENSKPLNPSSLKKTVGSLGLANVKRRLNLLYPQKHELLIEETKDTFKVNLWIKL